ncbi:translation initiation factor 3 subunit H, partial [Tremellales sp. Uapishka_1]
MTSMAAALAASLPTPVVPQVVKNVVNSALGSKVPARMEGVVDVEGLREVETVQLNALVFLKIMKHSTDVLPPVQPQNMQSDRNAPPQTNLSSHQDCLGILLGLDLDGVMEVEDCFALPPGEASVGGNSYPTKLLNHLREVSTPDSPVGIYLSTHNGGFVTRSAIELMVAVEKAAGRSKAVLVIHDVSKSTGGDLSVKAYRLSEGAREAAKAGKWDTAALIEHRITANTLLTTLPLTITSPALLSAFLSTLTTSSKPSAPSLTSPVVPFPQT